MSAWTLVCVACDAPAGDPAARGCPACGGRLDPRYPEAALATLRRPASEPGVRAYRALLPLAGPPPFLGEARTPLLLSRRVGPRLGLGQLAFKHEGLNRTGSFKDRGACVSVAKAREAGARGLLIASTGNAGAAVAAYGAALDLPVHVLADAGAPAGKLRQLGALGSRLLRVEGLFDRGPAPLVALLEDVAARLGLWVATAWAPTNPYALEGTRTLAYELADWRPGLVVCPTSGGDLIAAAWKGFGELVRAGVLPEPPRLVAAQPEGGAPLVRAVEGASPEVPTLASAHTIASGLKTTFSGRHALEAIRASGGTAVAVSDAEMLEAQRALATTEGIWVEPSAAASVAALARLQARGLVEAATRVVCVLTGAGFKDETAGPPRAEIPVLPFDAEAVATACRGRHPLP